MIFYFDGFIRVFIIVEVISILIIFVLVIILVCSVGDNLLFGVDIFGMLCEVVLGNLVIVFEMVFFIVVVLFFFFLINFFIFEII